MIEFEKRIDVDGPLLACIYPGCNVNTNGRWKYDDLWFPACKKEHLSSKLLREMKEEMLKEGE